jgi:hypothetical protein
LAISQFIAISPPSELCYTAMTAFNTLLHVVGGQQAFICLFPGHLIELRLDFHYLMGDHMDDDLPR